MLYALVLVSVWPKVSDIPKIGEGGREGCVCVCVCVCVFVSFANLVDKGEIDTLYPYKLPPMHALVNMPPKKLQLPIISIMLFIIIIISIVKKPPHAKSHFNTLAILQSCQTKNSVPKSPNPQSPQVREKKEDLSLLGGFHSGKLGALLLLLLLLLLLHFLD
jgi:hypothetical protein